MRLPERQLLGGAAHVDGHHRAQARLGRLLVARLEHRAEPAGRRGERDVVDRAAERALDGLEVLEPGVGHGEAALLADRAVERRVRRGADLVAEQQLGERAAAVRDLRQLGGMQDGVDAGADAVQQRGRQVRQTRAVVGRRRACRPPAGAGPARASRRAAGAPRRPSRRRRPCSDGSCSPAPSGRPRALRAAPSPRAACRARAGATRTPRPIRSSSASPPGAGSAARRTCPAMSKAASGTQLGQVRPPVVGSESRWR